MIIIHKDAGLADPMAKAYWNEVRRDRRLSIRETRYVLGIDPPNYPVPAIRQCYCGYTLQQHRDEMPCDNLGLLNY